MSFLATTSKNSFNLEDLALKRIADLIKRFHSVLMPKANNTGVYRELSDDEEYLLAHLDSESQNSLHSILAGCLAIDSCLSNIFQSQRILTENILKSFSLFLGSFAFSRPKEMQPSYTILLDNVLYLSQQLHQLPFCEQSSQFQKQLEIISHLKLKDDKLVSSIEISEDWAEERALLNEELKKSIKKIPSEDLGNSDNIRESPTFKALLHSAKDEKKMITLPIYERTVLLNEIYSENTKLKQELKRMQGIVKKYKNQTESILDPNIPTSSKIFEDESSTNNFGRFAGRNSGKSLLEENNKLHLKIIEEQKEELDLLTKSNSTLKNELNFYKRTVDVLKEEFEEEKKGFLGVIKKLEKQIWLISGYQGVDLYELLNELEEEVEYLKSERKDDQRVLMEVQEKLRFLNTRNKFRFDADEDFTDYEQPRNATRINKSRVSDYYIERSRARSRSRSHSNISKFSQLHGRNSSKLKAANNRKETLNTARQSGNYERVDNRRSTVSGNRPESFMAFEEFNELEIPRGHHHYLTKSSQIHPTMIMNSKGILKNANTQNKERKSRKYEIEEEREAEYLEEYERYRRKYPQQQQNSLRPSQTETNLLKNMKKTQFIDIPVIESLPYPESYGSPSMKGMDRRTFLNNQALERTEPEHKKTLKGYHSNPNLQRNRMVGFEDMVKQGKKNKERVQMPSYPMSFQNVFETPQDSLEVDRNPRGKMMRNEVEISPLTLKDIGAGRPYYRGDGSQNERVMVFKKDRA